MSASARHLMLLLALAPLLAACGSPIVGAECADGFVLCDGRCVDVSSDSAHCGSCGESCGDLECNAGSCGPGPRDDGGMDAGTRDDGGPREDGGGMLIDSGRKPPTIGRGSVGHPFTPDGGFVFPDDAVVNGCAIGQTECSDVCADLLIEHEHCGSCGRACDAEQFCSEGECVDICSAPLRPCAGSCVDFATNERHCGSCGNVCRSGLCEDGLCADAVPGHLFVIGHDYVQRPPPNMQRIAGNALFLASGAPVRTLVYRGAAEGASVAGVNAAIDFVAGGSSVWSQTQVEPDRLGAQLVDADALLIHAQAGASDVELLELGQRWGLAITQFLLRGGAVLLFETLSESNAGTHQLLGPAGLFVADGISEVPARRELWFTMPGVGVAVRSTAFYLSQPTTVRFLDVASAGMPAVVDEDGEAVVIHRVVVP